MGGAAMKRVTRGTSIWIDGLELPVNNDPALQQSCYTEILERLSGQMHAYLSHHRRMLTLRLDLHLQQYTGNSRLMSQLLQRLAKQLKRDYGITRLGYLWAREQERAKQQHYHLLLLLDGDKVQHPSALIQRIEALWQGLGQPKPFTPINCYRMVARGDLDAFKQVFYRASYLAKVRGKGYRDQAAKDYSASRLKPRPALQSEELNHRTAQLG